MTVGTKTYSSFTMYQPRQEFYSPSGATVNTGPMEGFGTSDVKTWSGTDNPPTAPVYRNYTFYFRPRKARYRMVHANGKRFKILVSPGRDAGFVEKLKRVGRVKPQEGNNLVERYLNTFDPFKDQNDVRKAYRVRQNLTTGSRVKQADHPYTMTRIAVTYEPVANHHYAYRFPPGGVVLSDTQYTRYAGLPVVDSTTAWNSNDDIALLGKLRTKVVGSDFHLGVFLGEGRAALTMIADNATRIYRALNAVKRGDIVKAARYLSAPPPKAKVQKTVAQNWLMLQYGWLPLLQDVHGGAEFLAKQLEFPLVQTYRARLRKRHKVTSPSGVLESWGSAETTGQIIARLSEADVAQMVGLIDPLSVAWELLPWSFVVDWFIPIGNYLSARSFVQGMNGVFVTTKVERRSRHQRANQFVQTFPTDYYVASPNGCAEERYVSLQRTISTSLAVPLPSVKKLSDVPSWKRAANAVALIVTNGKKRPGS